MWCSFIGMKYFYLSANFFIKPLIIAEVTGNWINTLIGEERQRQRWTQTLVKILLSLRHWLWRCWQTLSVRTPISPKNSGFIACLAMVEKKKIKIEAEICPFNRNHFAAPREKSYSYRPHLIRPKLTQPNVTSLFRAMFSMPLESLKRISPEVFCIWGNP